jgi:putative intracellular protease/amidase
MIIRKIRIGENNHSPEKNNLYYIKYKDSKGNQFNEKGEYMKAYLYILDTLADWEIGYITAELISGRYLDKRKGPVSLIKTGNSKYMITTMGGIEITPDERIDRINFMDGDLLILPGADTWFDDNNQKVLDIVSSLLDREVVIAAICGATSALAKNGILNSRKHTSNDREYLKMICPEYTGENLYINEPAAVDGNLITASGLAPLEFAYEVFRKTGVMREDTLDAWYNLYKTRDGDFFYKLMDSLS